MLEAVILKVCLIYFETKLFKHYKHVWSCHDTIDSSLTKCLVGWPKLMGFFSVFNGRTAVDQEPLAYRVSWVEHSHTVNYVMHHTDIALHACT